MEINPINNIAGINLKSLKKSTEPEPQKSVDKSENLIKELDKMSMINNVNIGKKDYELNLSMEELEKRTHKDYLTTKKMLAVDAPEYLELEEGDKEALAFDIRKRDHSVMAEKTFYQQGDFNMTSDSKLFKPRPWWEERGYKPDLYGRWIGPDGAVSLPLYEGRMINHFDFSEKGWVSGKGRSAQWRAIDWSEKVLEPQYLMEANV